MNLKQSFSSTKTGKGRSSKERLPSHRGEGARRLSWSQPLLSREFERQKKQGDQARERIFPDQNASWQSRLVLTELQNFPNFAMARIPRFIIAISLCSGLLNLTSTPSRIVLKFCQLGLPISRKTDPPLPALRSMTFPSLIVVAKEEIEKSDRKTQNRSTFKIRISA